MLRQCVDCHGVKGATVCTRCGDTGQVPVFVSTERPDIKGFLASAAVLAPLPEVPDREFDNGGDIERDLMRPEWRAFDQAVADADPERLRVALMVLNSVLSTRDREMAVRVMKNETQTDVENREIQEVDDADVR